MDRPKRFIEVEEGVDAPELPKREVIVVTGDRPVSDYAQLELRMMAILNEMQERGVRVEMAGDTAVAYGALRRTACYLTPVDYTIDTLAEIYGTSVERIVPDVSMSYRMSPAAEEPQKPSRKGLVPTFIEERNRKHWKRGRHG